MAIVVAKERHTNLNKGSFPALVLRWVWFLFFAFPVPHQPEQLLPTLSSPVSLSRSLCPSLPKLAIAAEAKMASISTVSVDAKPYAFAFEPRHTALLVIDMQRDFLLANGFGAIQGGNLEAVQASIEPTKRLLEACRQAGLTVIHTREGHRPDLADLPSSKIVRQAAAPNNSQHMLVIGQKGPLGRLLVRGEHGHDIVDELKPLPNEVVIDKPGKGAFWNTTLMHQLKARAITHLIVSGVTTECCFATTIREANDRGFECCKLAHVPLWARESTSSVLSSDA